MTYPGYYYCDKVSSVSQVRPEFALASGRGAVFSFNDAFSFYAKNLGPGNAIIRLKTGDAIFTINLTSGEEISKLPLFVSSPERIWVTLSTVSNQGARVIFEHRN